MKKVLAAVAVLACFIAFTSDTVARTLPPKQTGTAKVERFTGRVISVNAPDMTMVVESKVSGMTFDIGKAKLKGYSSIRSIKEGDRVTVQYVMKEGKAAAKIINKNKSYNYR